MAAPGPAGLRSGLQSGRDRAAQTGPRTGLPYPDRRENAGLPRRGGISTVDRSLASNRHYGGSGAARIGRSVLGVQVLGVQGMLLRQHPNTEYLNTEPR